VFSFEFHLLYQELESLFIPTRYYKWKCPNIKVEKERRKSKEVAYVVSPQKA